MWRVGFRLARPSSLALRARCLPCCCRRRALPSPLLAERAAPRVCRPSSRRRVTDRVLGCLKNFQKVDPTKVTSGSHFMNDPFSTVDTAEVVMLEDEFAIEILDADAEKIHSCEDAIKYVLNHPHAK